MTWPDDFHRCCGVRKVPAGTTLATPPPPMYITLKSTVPHDVLARAKDEWRKVIGKPGPKVDIEPVFGRVEGWLPHAWWCKSRSARRDWWDRMGAMWRKPETACAQCGFQCAAFQKPGAACDGWRK